MTAHELVNSLGWPGHLGQLVACTSRMIPASALGEPEDVRASALWQRIAISYGLDVDGEWYEKPWLEVHVRVDRVGSTGPARSVSLIIPEGAHESKVVGRIHDEAMLLLKAELYKSADVGGTPVWDYDTLTATARWVGPR